MNTSQSLSSCGSLFVDRFPLLIGLVGHNRVGKDTVANYLTERYGYQRLAFADCIKDTCKIMFDLSDDQLESTKDTLDTRWKCTPRHIFKTFGTEIIRNNIKKYIDSGFKYSFWIERVKMEIDKSNKPVVISDVRFMDEAQFIRENNGILVKIVRNRPVVVTHTDEPHHASEIQVDLIEYDYIIENKGSIDELYDTIRGL